MADAKNTPPAEGESKLARFIQTYSGFLSSFVIGVAGLVATSIWQYRQGEISRRQADSQEQMARQKADNDWRIARAEILAKNLDVLSSTDAASTDRRFGVLLSLTRGEIIDPELAVSYALELGKDSAAYMRSILSSTKHKSYAQLARAFALTCIQRFGVERAAEICKDDRLAERSAAIADMIRDDMEALNQLQGDMRQGPMSLLIDEDDVQSNPSKLSWLFEPYLQALYEHRRWKEIDAFERFSQGARLVAALTLATARTGELLSEGEIKVINKFHDDRRQWLSTYLLGRKCDADCRARIVEFMLSTVQESDGDYDSVLKEVLLRPRNEAGHAFVQVHTRILWCQIDADDLALLRDRVLVPTVREAVGRAKDPATTDDMVALFALTSPPSEPQPLALYNAARAAVRSNDRLERLYQARQAHAQRQRANPPPMIRRVNFCGVAETPPAMP
jgi:hypothetical protein